MKVIHILKKGFIVKKCIPFLFFSSRVVIELLYVVMFYIFETFEKAIKDTSFFDVLFNIRGSVGCI